MLTPREIEDLALELVGIRSVNSTPGEAEVIQFLADRLRESAPARRGDLKVHLIPGTGDPLGRPVLLAHAPGRGAAGVLLMGHLDTVGVDDYLDLADLATSPRALTERVAQGAFGEEMAALARSGKWLFGRGVLDMKSGVAAALAAFLSLAERGADGHLLFAATPDEEGSSHGVRALDAWLPGYLAAEGIQLGAVLNTDYTTARPGDEGAFHAYAGSTGKLLPGVYVQGVPSHAAEPERGLDPIAVLAAITGEVAYSGALRDAAHGELAPPPVPLYARDLKPFYDVQTAIAAASYYNLFHRSRTPGEQLERFLAQVREGIKVFARRVEGMSLPEVPVLSFAELAAASAGAPLPPLAGLDAPEAARRIVATLASHAFPGQPVAVCYFAGPLIPSVESPAWAVQALESAVAEERMRCIVHRHYPYISDLSFLTGSDDWLDPAFPANYPPEWAGEAAGSPPQLRMAPLMAGPHGFGAHQPTERVLRRHAFDLLPRLLHRAARHLLASQPID